MAITKRQVNEHPQDSFEYIVLHAQWQAARGRNPSASLWYIKDPRKALEVAKWCSYFPKNGTYLNGEAPDWYTCAICGATHCKLWRMGSSSHIELHCAECAAADQDMDISDMDEDGRFTAPWHGMKTDQISSYVPAIPHEEIPASYWGYTSVPRLAVEWWRKLSTFRNTP